MSSEHEVLDMFERANPVHDPELVQVEPDASRYLADLLHDDPTAIRTEPVDRQPLTDRRPWLLPVAAAAVAVLVVTGLVLVVRGNSTDQAPADTPPATAPDPDSDVPVSTAPSTVIEPPAGTLVTESGQTIASLVGDINWTRVDGDAASLPHEVLFEYEGQYVGVDADGTSWRSDDARTWTEIDPLPSGDHAFVEFEGIWTILDSPDPGQSPRLGEWDRTSFRAVELPGPWPQSVPAGLRVTGRSAHIDTSAYELLVIESATYGLDPANDVIEFGDDVDMSDVGINWVDDHTYRVTLTEDGASQQIGPDLTLSADPSNPSVVQITSPEGIVGRVGPWPGLDAEQLISRLHTGHLQEHREVYAGNRATHFFTQAASNIDGEVLGLSSSASARFTVVSENDGSGLSLLVNDNRVDEIPMSEPGPIRRMTITGSDYFETDSDRGAILHFEIDPPLHAEDWFTDDGTSWQPTNAPRYLGGVLAADFGWVKHSREEFYTLEQLATTGYPLSVSAGGIDWDDISIDLDIDPEVDDQIPFVTVTVANDTIFVSVDDGENRTLWVGDVNPHDGG
jgi:hypothetical protein